MVSLIISIPQNAVQGEVCASKTSMLLLTDTQLHYDYSYNLVLYYKNLIWVSVLDGSFQPKGWPC